MIFTKKYIVKNKIREDFLPSSARVDCPFHLIVILQLQLQVQKVHLQHCVGAREMSHTVRALPQASSIIYFSFPPEKAKLLLKIFAFFHKSSAIVHLFMHKFDFSGKKAKAKAKAKAKVPISNSRPHCSLCCCSIFVPFFSPIPYQTPKQPNHPAH